MPTVGAIHELSLQKLVRSVLTYLVDPFPALPSALLPQDRKEIFFRFLATRLERERLDGLFYDLTKKRGCWERYPVLFRSRLEKNYYTRAARNIRLLDELAILQSAVGSWQLRVTSPTPEIPVVLLKGAYLVPFLYGNLALRSMTDLDLLVPRFFVYSMYQFLVGKGYRIFNDQVVSESFLLSLEKEPSRSVPGRPYLHSVMLCKQTVQGRYWIHLHWGLANAEFHDGFTHRIPLAEIWSRGIRKIYPTKMNFQSREAPHPNPPPKRGRETTENPRLFSMEGHEGTGISAHQGENLALFCSGDLRSGAMVPSLYHLIPEVHFIYLACHALKHGYSPWILLYDLFLLYPRVNLFQMMDWAKAWRVERPVFYALWLLKNGLDVDVPRELLREARPVPWSSVDSLYLWGIQRRDPLNLRLYLPNLFWILLPPFAETHTLRWRELAGNLFRRWGRF